MSPERSGTTEGRRASLWKHIGKLGQLSRLPPELRRDDDLASVESGPLLSGFIPINKENEMFGRSSLMAAALLAGLANAGSAQPYERTTPSRSRGPALASGSSTMMFGVNKGGRGSVASDKRASAKRRNKQRNKAAHRG